MCMKKRVLTEQRRNALMRPGLQTEGVLKFYIRGLLDVTSLCPNSVPDVWIRGQLLHDVALDADFENGVPRVPAHRYDILKCMNIKVFIISSHPYQLSSNSERIQAVPNWIAFIGSGVK